MLFYKAFIRLREYTEVYDEISERAETVCVSKVKNR